MATNIYDVPSGGSAGYGHIVGHVASNGDVYDTPAGSGAGRGHIVGSVASNGDVYDTPAGAYAGYGHIVGHVEGSDSIQAGAALLLLNLRSPGSGNSSNFGVDRGRGYQPNPANYKASVTILVVLVLAVIAVLYMVRPSLLISLVYLAVLVGLGLFVGKLLRNRKKK